MCIIVEKLEFPFAEDIILVQITDDETKREIRKSNDNKQ